MVVQLLTYLKHELQLLTEMNRLADIQQKALINYRTSELEEVSSYQEHMARSLAEAEENRIELLIKWLDISRDDALNLRLSTLEKEIQGEELKELKNMRRQLQEQMTKLDQTNKTNRVLTNRGQRSINKIIGMFSDGRNHVCNVKV